MITFEDVKEKIEVLKEQIEILQEEMENWQEREPNCYAKHKMPKPFDCSLQESQLFETYKHKPEDEKYIRIEWEEKVIGKPNETVNAYFSISELKGFGMEDEEVIEEIIEVMYNEVKEDYDNKEDKCVAIAEYDVFDVSLKYTYTFFDLQMHEKPKGDEYITVKWKEKVKGHEKSKVEGYLRLEFIPKSFIDDILDGADHVIDQLHTEAQWRAKNNELFVPAEPIAV